MKLAGWGRFRPQKCKVFRPRSLDQLREAVALGPVIARGNGRAYGDSAVARLGTIDMRAFNRFIAFDDSTGLLTVEAGVLLDEVITAFLPRGWFPKVTPGTRFVTLGGMVASDVHGKNHHSEGGFGQSVKWLEVMAPSGELRRICPETDAQMFDATLGGMGLTGVITKVAFYLRKVETGWISQETIPTKDLEDTLQAFEAHAEATYSVAWIDCLAQGPSLGRAILTVGEHAPLRDLSQVQRRAPLWPASLRRLRFPFTTPAFLLNRYSVGAFNALYYAKGRKAPRRSLISWESYFYPLDAIADWNRLYGGRGFVQYQCVIPLPQAAFALRALLGEISAAGAGSFLAVLKRMGPQGRGLLSFPTEGYTLALDFPASDASLALIGRLEAITIRHGGRHYLTKDALMSAEGLAQSDPRALAFKTFRAERGLDAHFASSQSERLSL